MSSRLFIIEGPDCTGKTTLARFMLNYLTQKQRHVFYFHATHTPSLSNAQHDYQMSILRNAIDYIKLTGGYAIIDRLWPSNTCYGGVLKNQDVFDPKEIRDLIRNNLGCYIFADCESCVERHEQEKDDGHPYDAEQYDKIREAYWRLSAELTRSKDECVFYYNMDTDGADLLKYLQFPIGIEL